MQFSKLKKTLEGFLCDSLKGRIEVHAAVYRHSHDDKSRVWLTLDKDQLFSAADLSFHMAHHYLYENIKEELKLKPIPYSKSWEEMFNSPERAVIVEVSDHVEQQLIEQGIMESWHLYKAFMEYPNLSINEALSSKDSFTRAFALFDRRVGKRRLLKMETLQHPLEQKFYAIRCKAEGF
ncbi:nonribosomal peptide synthetase [Lysinibacillus telephonicus]|uniref:Nonribosomal peptide synthetase n=1 Tax=Lysinibacillus telephonicus TaxID=1714840 RepID=A0A431UMA4_9BACI|nr:nonribosomal peptide synthetase [Lysinibacillus telephonicus]RTQ90582.1 nonribosomal peptide synthetase [Lysinibacillus telephonicus]